MTVARLALLLFWADRSGMTEGAVARLFRELSPEARAAYLTRAVRELAPSEEKAA